MSLSKGRNPSCATRSDELVGAMGMVVRSGSEPKDVVLVLAGDVS